jgi:NAD(P)-dependent dehydrogenase (short-subunit alcohol dehydrogenase family)
MQTVFVTGGAGTLGRAVVADLEGRGWRVVAPGRADADLFDAAAVTAAVDAAAGVAEAPLKGVVNVVGGFADGQRIADTPVDDFEAMFRLNLRATYLVTQAAIPHLGADGAIVNVSSRAALKPFAGAAGYCASKAALITLTEVTALEGVRCNVVLPSGIGGDAVPPEDIAPVIAHLLSADSRATSGASVPVYGA